MNIQSQNKEQIQLGLSYEQIKQKWNKMSSSYISYDSAPQTFFYTLTNMLKLNQAKNILEIACGAGKLIPQVLDLKVPEAFYYATDISEQMLHFAKIRLQKHFEKYESKLTFEEWMKKQRLQFGVVNGEQKIPKKIKFDRIICNLVLMLTTDPKKMLLNLFEHAEDNCLLGLAVWGDKPKSNIFQFMEKLMNQHGVIPSNSRPNFFLADRIQTLVEECGWETVLCWNQNAMFPVIEFEEGKQYHPFIEKDILPRFPKEIHGKIFQKINEFINKQKCGLNFSAKLMIVRKKQKLN